MTDIRKLLTEASTSVDVGPADPVGLVREGLSRRRRTQAALVGVVAAIATAIAVPVALAGSSKTAPIAVGPTVDTRHAPLMIYEVVDAAHPARDTRVVRLDGTRVEIRRTAAGEIHPTSADVRHDPGGWDLGFYAPDAGDVFPPTAGPGAKRIPPSFVALVQGEAYRVSLYPGYRIVVFTIGHFRLKRDAYAVAESLTSTVFESRQVTVTTPPQCTPNVKNCKRFMRRIQRMIRNQHRADQHRVGH